MTKQLLIFGAIGLVALAAAGCINTSAYDQQSAPGTYKAYSPNPGSVGRGRA